jgi:hypothetical protein
VSEPIEKTVLGHLLDICKDAEVGFWPPPRKPRPRN